MKMGASCGDTNAAGLSNAPTHGSVSSAGCWSAMNICSLPIAPSSISPASGLLCAGVYETRSRTLLGNGSPNQKNDICSKPLIYHPRTDGATRAIAILREIRNRKYDTVIDFEQCSLLTASFAQATSIPVRIGFVPPEPGPRNRFFTHSVPLREEESMWSCFLQIGRLLNPTLPEKLQTVPLPCSSEAREWSDQWWSANFGNHAGPWWRCILALVPALNIGVGQ